MRITKDDSGYPKRLAALGQLQAPLTVSTPLGDPERVVAIVGSRTPGNSERDFARGLARALARAGATIISGGARGIDTAAHEGALEGGGATWVVSPVQPGVAQPPENAELFQRIETNPPSAMIWPFETAADFEAVNARARNRVLVALADAIVVVQAALRSGSRNTMRWARDMGKPLWVVPAAPWMAQHVGSLVDLRDGRAQPLWDPLQLFHSLGLPSPDRKSLSSDTVELPRPGKDTVQKATQEHLFRLSDVPLGTEEMLVISVLSDTPTHVDSIIDDTGLTIPTVRSALLTLTMKNVVVEGPDGFFRRQMEG